MADVKISQLTSIDAATIGANKTSVEVGTSYSGTSYRLNLADLTRASVQSPGTGGLTDYDLEVGGTDYGIQRFGNASIGCSSLVAANLDLDGAILLRNIGGPATSQIEFAFADSTNAIRFALPKGGVGNATYNPRSMLIAGPAPADSAAVTVGYWQGQGIFDNLTCNTSVNGADLGVQNDLEVEGTIYADSIQESTTAAGLAVASGDLRVASGALQFGGTTATEVMLKRSGTELQVRLADDSAHAPLSSSSLTVYTGASAGFTLAAEAASLAGIRNGTNAQELRIYETYSSPAANTFMYLRSTGSEFRAGTTHVGGATRPLKWYIGNSNCLNMQTYGRLDVPVKLYVTNTLEMGDGDDIQFQTTTGTKIGTATTEKIGFWNVTPVVQQVLATGSTTDQVITLLQTLGLCRQS